MASYEVWLKDTWIHEIGNVKFCKGYEELQSCTYTTVMIHDEWTIGCAIWAQSSTYTPSYST